MFEETVGPLAKIVELTRKKPCHRVVGLRRTPVRLRRRAIVTDSHGGQQFNTAQLKWDAPLTVTAACTRGGSRPEPEINRVDSITSLLLLHPSPNIRNFNILFVLFNHSSYKKNLELSFFSYFIIQSALSHNFLFFIFV